MHAFLATHFAQYLRQHYGDIARARKVWGRMWQCGVLMLSRGSSVGICHHPPCETATSRVTHIRQIRPSPWP
jgi:hypothetical protein